MHLVPLLGAFRGRFGVQAIGITWLVCHDTGPLDWDSNTAYQLDNTDQTRHFEELDRRIEYSASQKHGSSGHFYEQQHQECAAIRGVWQCHSPLRSLHLLLPAPGPPDREYRHDLGYFPAHSDGDDVWTNSVRHKRARHSRDHPRLHFLLLGEAEYALAAPQKPLRPQNEKLPHVNHLLFDARMLHLSASHCSSSNPVDLVSDCAVEL